VRAFYARLIGADKKPAEEPNYYSTERSRATGSRLNHAGAIHNN
jgi:hypothetical protein